MSDVQDMQYCVIETKNETKTMSVRTCAFFLLKYIINGTCAMTLCNMTSAQTSATASKVPTAVFTHCPYLFIPIQGHRQVGVPAWTEGCQATSGYFT